MGKPHKKKLTPTYNGIVAAYEYEGITSGMMWWDSAVGTRPNGVAAGAPYNNWTGLPVSLIPPPTAVPPTFDAVDDTCGTGQAYLPGSPTGLNSLYQEWGTYPVPMELPTTGTIEVWAKPSSTGGSRTILGYHTLVRLGSNGTNFTLWLSGIGYNDATPITINNWYHLLVTFTYGGTFDFWINGVKQLSAQPFVATHTTQRAWFIGDIYSSAWPFGGEIDTVRFYNRVLTDDEALRNYRSGLRFHS